MILEEVRPIEVDGEGFVGFTGAVEGATATAEELKALPGIGDTLAQRIIEYRTQHGNFRRPQEIIIIEGFSEKRYRAIADLICVEGGK